MRKTLQIIAVTLTLALAGTLSAQSASAASMDGPLKIGIIGTGKIGSALARAWVKAGHEVFLSSRHPEQFAGTGQGAGSYRSRGYAAPGRRLRFGGPGLYSLRRHAADRRRFTR